jgi:hypothetical protein
MDAIQKYARDLDPGIGQFLLTQSAACCSAFAHTFTSPTSLDSRCSATGPEQGAPDNGQAVDAGQAAARIHRMHHSNENERPVGGAKIGHAEEPASAAGAALSPYYLLPPHAACSRHKLLPPATWHQGRRRRAHSVPPDHPRRKNEENRSITTRACHMAPVGIYAKPDCLLEKRDKW